MLQVVISGNAGDGGAGMAWTISGSSVTRGGGGGGIKCTGGSGKSGAGSYAEHKVQNLNSKHWWWWWWSNQRGSLWCRW